MKRMRNVKRRKKYNDRKKLKEPKNSEEELISKKKRPNRREIKCEIEEMEQIKKSKAHTLWGLVTSRKDYSPKR
jgi:hypothetical protein